MATVTAAFTCDYELVGYGQALDIIELAKDSETPKIKARSVSTYSRRKFYSELSSLTHQAGNTSAGTGLPSLNGNGVLVYPSPSSAVYFCAQDNLEHSDYGPTGYVAEQWVSYSPYVDWMEYPAAASGTDSTFTAGTGGCVSPWGIQSSLTDTEIRRYTDAEEVKIDQIRKRHEFIISREGGNITSFVPSVGQVKAGSVFNIDFGINSLNSATFLSPSFSGFYICISDEVQKNGNSALMIETQVWVSYTPWVNLVYTGMVGEPTPPEE